MNLKKKSPVAKGAATGSTNLTRLFEFKSQHAGIIKAPRHTVGVFLGGAVESAINPLCAEAETAKEELGVNIAFTNDADDLRTILAKPIGKLMKQEGADAGAAFRFQNGAAQKTDRVPARFIDEVTDNFTIAFGDKRAALFKIEAEFKILTGPREFERGAFNIENGVKVAFRDLAARERRVDRGKGGIESKKVVIIHK